MPDRTEFLTVPEVMAYLRLGRTTVYAQARLYLATGGAEGIPCRRFGRSLRFPADALARFAVDPGERPRPAPAPSAVASRRPEPSPRQTRSRSSSRTRSQSPRTANRPDDDVVQAALPFTD